MQEPYGNLIISISEVNSILEERSDLPGYFDTD
jgi:hypothetical protein